ncbi:MAG: hypothetical protein ABJN69_07230 [Hellea sp.]
MAKGKRGHFVADVSALELSDEMIKQIDEGIQKVVLSALSGHRDKFDEKFSITRLRDFRRWGGGTLGIWIGDRDMDGIPDNMDPEDNFPRGF